MSNMLKCPNPSCPYVFDPSLVPVGVVLSCPRCGMQFTLGAPSAAQTQTQAPTAPSAPAYPPSAPLPREEESHPEFEAVGRTAVEERDPEEVLPTRGTSKLQVYIFAGIAAALMAGTALAVYFLYVRRNDGDNPDTGVTRLPDYNVSVAGVPADWKRDDDLRVNLGPPQVIAYRRDKPEAYVAFGAWEPKEKGRLPRPSEMRKELRAALPKLFVLSTLRDDEPFPEPQWLGQDIAAEHGFKFRAQSQDGLTWAGEACTVTSKGMAYVWLNWCGEADYDGLKEEFAAFRARFKLLDLRKDRPQTQPNVIHYKGDKVSYTLSDAEELWKEVSPEELKTLQETDPDLDKRLRISLPPRRDRRGLPDEAELSVYIFDGAAGDAAQVARKFAEQRETNRIRMANADLTPPTFRELTDPPQGDPVPNTVPATATVVRLLSNVKESPSASRLIVVSGHKVGDKTVVVHCWCEGVKRDSFETKFVQIASSLR